MACRPVHSDEELGSNRQRANTDQALGSRGDAEPPEDDWGDESPPAQAMFDLQVQVPPGAFPGSTLQVQAPNGQVLEVVVPQGVYPGQAMIVRVPDPGFTPLDAPTQDDSRTRANSPEFEIPEVPDWLKERLWAQKKLGCVLLLFFIILILFLSSFKKVGPYHYGLVKNGVTHRVDMEIGAFEPGVHLVGFWNHFVYFPKTLQTIQFSFDSPEPGVQHVPPLHLRSNDKVPVYIEVSVQYMRNKDTLIPFFKVAMTETLQENIIISNLRAELIKTMFQFNVAVCWEERETLRKAFLRACETALARNGIKCFSLQLYRSHLDKFYEEALIRTQLEKQQRLIAGAQKRAAQVRAETLVELADFERNITIIEAEARAERYNIAGIASTEAASNKVDAQALALKNLKVNLTLPNGSSMTALQLTKYERRLMIGTSLEKPHFYYGIDGKGPVFMTMGSSRRLVESSATLGLRTNEGL